MRVRRSMRTLALVACLPLGALGAEIDPATGLVVGGGWEDVRAHCGSCHSFRLVTLQRADRATWRAMIRWMQETQNFWMLPPDVERRILDYLAANYPPGQYGRRPPIARELMP